MNKKEKVQHHENREERKLKISFDLLKRTHTEQSCLAPKACGDHE
jgi:hypothetical protein